MSESHFIPALGWADQEGAEHEQAPPGIPVLGAQGEEGLVTDFWMGLQPPVPSNILFLQIKQGSHHLWFWDVSFTPGQ